MDFSFHPLPCRSQKVVALKLHGVDVDIKVIKRKGEPLYDPAPIEPPTPPDDPANANDGGGDGSCPCAHNNATIQPSLSSPTSIDPQTTHHIDRTATTTTAFFAASDGETTLDENDNASESPSSSSTNWQTTPSSQFDGQSEHQQPLSLNQCCSRSMSANTIDCLMDAQHPQHQPRQTNPFGRSSGMFDYIEDNTSLYIHLHLKQVCVTRLREKFVCQSGIWTGNRGVNR